MSFTNGFKHRLLVGRKLVLIVLVVLSLTVMVASAGITEAGPSGGGAYCPGC
ncbi:MAG: hypothetical protein H0X30_10525 [Anaerolineae bacterium]|nr:hypothetical protein [Anaerolineae bacterium]